MSGPLLAAAARNLDQRRAAKKLQKRATGPALLDDLRPFFDAETSSSGAGDETDGSDNSSEFSDVAGASPSPAGNTDSTFVTGGGAEKRPHTSGVRAAPKAEQDAAGGAKEPPTRRRHHRAPYEKPFEPAQGARQLAHAKQRIWDLESTVHDRDEELVAVRAAMTKHAELVDYMRETMLRDVLASIRVAPPGDATAGTVSGQQAAPPSMSSGSAGSPRLQSQQSSAVLTSGETSQQAASRRAGTYNVIVTSLFDDERMATLQSEVRTLLTSNADGRRDARIRQLEAKEAKLLTRVSRLAMRIKHMQLDVQTAQRETARAHDQVQAAQRLLKQRDDELSTAKLKVLERDTCIHQRDHEIGVVRSELAAARSEEEELKRELSARDETIAQLKRQAESGKDILMRSLANAAQCLKDVTAAQARAASIGVNKGGDGDWAKVRVNVSEGVERLRKAAQLVAGAGESFEGVASVIGSAATALAVDAALVSNLGQQLSNATSNATAGASRLNTSLEGAIGAIDSIEKTQAKQHPGGLLEREPEIQQGLATFVGAVADVAHGGCQALFRRAAQAFSREIALWRSEVSVASSGAGGAVTTHGSSSPVPLSLPRRSSSRSLLPTSSAAAAAATSGAVEEVEELTDATETLDTLLDQLKVALQPAAPANASSNNAAAPSTKQSPSATLNDLRDRVGTSLARLKAVTSGAERKGSAAPMSQIAAIVALLEKEHELARKNLDDPFFADVDRLMRRSGDHILQRSLKCIGGSTLPPLLGGGPDFDPREAITSAPETMPIDKAARAVDEDAIAQEYLAEAGKNASELSTFARDAMRLGAAMAERPQLGAAARLISAALKLALVATRECEHWSNTAFAAVIPDDAAGSYASELRRVLEANCTVPGIVNRAPVPAGDGAPDISRATPALVTQPFVPQLRPMSASTRATAGSPARKKPATASSDGKGRSMAAGGESDATLPPPPALADEAVGAIGLRLAAIRRMRQATGLGATGVVVAAGSLAETQSELLRATAAAEAASVAAAAAAAATAAAGSKSRSQSPLQRQASLVPAMSVAFSPDPPPAAGVAFVGGGEEDDTAAAAGTGKDALEASASTKSGKGRRATLAAAAKRRQSTASKKAPSPAATLSPRSQALDRSTRRKSGGSVAASAVTTPRREELKETKTASTQASMPEPVIAPSTPPPAPVLESTAVQCELLDPSAPPPSAVSSSPVVAVEVPAAAAAPAPAVDVATVACQCEAPATTDVVPPAPTAVVDDYSPSRIVKESVATNTVRVSLASALCGPDAAARSAPAPISVGTNTEGAVEAFVAPTVGDVTDAVPGTEPSFGRSQSAASLRRHPSAVSFYEHRFGDSTTAPASPAVVRRQPSLAASDGDAQPSAESSGVGAAAYRGSSMTSVTAASAAGPMRVSYLGGSSSDARRQSEAHPRDENEALSAAASAARHRLPAHADDDAAAAQLSVTGSHVGGGAALVGQLGEHRRSDDAGQRWKSHDIADHRKQQQAPQDALHTAVVGAGVLLTSREDDGRRPLSALQAKAAALQQQADIAAAEAAAARTQGAYPSPSRHPPVRPSSAPAMVVGSAVVGSPVLGGDASSLALSPSRRREALESAAADLSATSDAHVREGDGSISTAPLVLDARKKAEADDDGHGPESLLRIAERRPRRRVPATVDVGAGAGVSMTLAQRRKEMEAAHAAIGQADSSFGGARDAPLPPRPLTPMAQPVSAFVKGACATRGASGQQQQHAPRPRSAAGDGTESPMPVRAGDVRAGSAIFSLSATPAHDRQLHHDGGDTRPTSPSHDRSRLPQRSPPRVRGALERLVGPDHGVLDRPGSAAPAVAERVAGGGTSAIARRIEQAKAGGPRRVTSAPPRRRIPTDAQQLAKLGGKKALPLSALQGSVAQPGDMDRALRARGVVHVPAN